MRITTWSGCDRKGCVCDETIQRWGTGRHPPPLYPRLPTLVFLWICVRFPSLHSIGMQGLLLSQTLYHVCSSDAYLISITIALNHIFLSTTKTIAWLFLFALRFKLLKYVKKNFTESISAPLLRSLMPAGSGIEPIGGHLRPSVYTDVDLLYRMW